VRSVARVRLPNKFAIPRPIRGRLGFSLTEMMVGLGVAGALTLVAIPKVQLTIERVRVKSARTEAFNRLAAARLAAQQGGRLVVFKVSSSSIWTEGQPRLVAAAGSTRDTLGSIINLSATYHVNVYTSTDSIVFDPRGLGTGTGIIRISLGQASDSVAISGFGGVIR